jgi:hypothetical protein
MTYKRALGAFLLLVILAVGAMIVNFSDLKSQDTVYVTRIDLAKEIFREPIEKIVFVTKGLKVFIFTTNQEDRIRGSTSQIAEYLEKHGVQIKDIAIIIHNHWVPTGFSEANNRTYHYFRNRGFRGFFCIYYQGTGNIRTKIDA